MMVLIGSDIAEIKKPIHIQTMASIIYIIGVVLSVLAVLDILKKPISLIGKAISIVLVLITSWVGLIVYYLYAKDHLTEWFK
jgi:uncharacterized protein YacL